MLLTRVLPVLAGVVLTIFALVDCAATPSFAARSLPKWAWIVLIVAVPILGAGAWLLAGRSPAESRARRSSATRPERVAFPHPPQHALPSAPIGPDDDPEFLRQLGRMVEQLRRDDGGTDPERRTP